MKAVVYTHCRPIDAEDALFDTTLPDPAPRQRDLLVEVKAVAVNPVDTKLRRQADPVGEKRVLGFDAAGVVRALGAGVTHFGVGDEVWYAGAINRAGANAEYQLVDERLVGRRPRRLSFAEAAAMPLATLTAWEMLFDRLQVPRAAAGSLLIVGGAGGVGGGGDATGARTTLYALRCTGCGAKGVWIVTDERPEDHALLRRLDAHEPAIAGPHRRKDIRVPAASSHETNIVPLRPAAKAARLSVFHRRPPILLRRSRNWAGCTSCRDYSRSLPAARG